MQRRYHMPHLRIKLQHVIIERIASITASGAANVGADIALSPYYQQETWVESGFGRRCYHPDVSANLGILRYMHRVDQINAQ